MASDKATPEGRLREAPSSDAQVRPSIKASGEMREMSDNLDRIASYLHDSRSASFERASGLAAEIAERRQELAGRLTRGSAFAELLGDIASELPDHGSKSGNERAAPETNPVLAERLHAFCREMDALLDSFRARISHERRVKH